MKGRVVEAFRERFGEAPARVVRAPGRVNLIGEHTDYNDGFVLPMAIERAVWIALRPRDDRRVAVTSLEFGEAAEFDLGRLERGGPGWAEYLKGTAWALTEAGYGLEGWEGVMGSDVPIGAGLSSSAALELATARALASVSDLPWDEPAMARLAQRAENEWVGMSCGIMDQMISAAGRAGHAVLIDCRTLETSPVPLPEGTVVVILDTATRRGLVGSAYNERRRQCEAAAAHFGVPALRDVSPGMLEAAEGGREGSRDGRDGGREGRDGQDGGLDGEDGGRDGRDGQDGGQDGRDGGLGGRDGAVGGLDPVTARRARHVVTENARTVAAAEAMRAGDAARLGRLMDESHRSLRDDFEVSTEALDTIVEIARARDGCLGARMTGAGFGGCAVALVEAAHAEAFAATVAEEYARRMSLEPAVYVTGAAGGAEVVGSGAGG